MACKVSVDQFMSVLGHDGSDIIRVAEEPFCRAGHHSQECVEAAMILGFKPVMIEAQPVTQAKGAEYAPTICGEHAFKRFLRYCNNDSGVMNVRTPKGNGHAVAFSHGVIYDPDGQVYTLDKLATLYAPFTLWIINA